MKDPNELTKEVARLTAEQAVVRLITLLGIVFLSTLILWNAYCIKRIQAQMKGEPPPKIVEVVKPAEAQCFVKYRGRHGTCLHRLEVAQGCYCNGAPALTCWDEQRDPAEVARMYRCKLVQEPD